MSHKITNSNLISIISNHITLFCEDCGIIYQLLIKGHQLYKTFFMIANTAGFDNWCSYLWYSWAGRSPFSDIVVGTGTLQGIVAQADQMLQHVFTLTIIRNQLGSVRWQAGACGQYNNTVDSVKPLVIPIWCTFLVNVSRCTTCSFKFSVSFKNMYCL